MLLLGWLVADASWRELRALVVLYTASYSKAVPKVVSLIGVCSMLLHSIQAVSSGTCRWVSLGKREALCESPTLSVFFSSDYSAKQLWVAGSCNAVRKTPSSDRVTVHWVSPSEWRSHQRVRNVHQKRAHTSSVSSRSDVNAPRVLAPYLRTPLQGQQSRNSFACCEVDLSRCPIETHWPKEPHCMHVVTRLE